MHTKNAKKNGLTAAIRHPFTVEEDTKLLEIMTTTKVINWEQIAANFQGRTARRCRERWVNYLNPNIRTGPWTENEDELLLAKVNEFGHCWSSISKHFNGRSDSDIKNRWYSHLKYKTVYIDGKLKFVSDPSESPFPVRKTRRKIKDSPQLNALRNLEQIKRKKIAENSIQMQILQQKNLQSQGLINQPFSLFYNTGQSQALCSQQVLLPLMHQQQQLQQLIQLKQLQEMQINRDQIPQQICTSSIECKDNNEKECTDGKFFSNYEFLEQTDYNEPECFDFWEPNLFDEVMTMDLSMNPRKGLHDMLF